MTTNDSSANGEERASRSVDAIRAWGAEWNHKFGAMLERGWPLAEVAALHDDLDRIASAADGLGDSASAAAAVELSVYLCSFVEDGRSPDPSQREKLLQLCGALGEAKAPAVSPAPAQAKPSRLAHLLCISEDAGLVAELSLRVAERGIAMTARSTVDDALSRLPELGMHAVLVDQTQLDGLQRLERAALNLGGGTGRPLFAAMLRDNSLEQRMRALRGGADVVIEFDEQPGRLAERAARLLRERDGAPLRAMIIDDDRSQAMFCESVLRHAGVETRLHTEARQALADFAQFRPEVVLVDLYMPDMDGMSLVAALRAQPDAAGVAIVFLSGDQDAETRFEALAAGGDDFLTKPILPRHLVAAVLTRGRRVRQMQAGASRRTSESLASNVREFAPPARAQSA